MNFGLLCDDPAAAPLIAALHRHPDHRVTRAVLVSERTDVLLHGVGGVQYTDRWEDLLTAKDVDAVILGGRSPVIWDGAKQLASEGIPLLVFPSLAEGAAVLYELSLIRDDRQGILFPAWCHRFDASVTAWKEGLPSAESPQPRYLRWEREVPLGPGAEVPRQVIEEHLLRDADLWRFLFGAADQVTALRTAGTATGAVIQSVVLTGRGAPELTWTIKSNSQEVCRVTMPSERDSRRLEWDVESQNWSISETDFASSKPTVGDGGSSDERLLGAFVNAVDRQPAKIVWTDVLHAAEIVDAAQRSLERRRTIELHHETLSERAIFKTQMAAMGCVVLVLTLLLMLSYLAIASLVPLDARILKVLRLAVFAPLFVFLLMQLLLPLTRTSNSRSAE